MIRYAPLPPFNAQLEVMQAALRAARPWERRRFLRKQGYPRFLFKYRPIYPDDMESIDRVRDVLVRSMLWLSSPTDFNDPFDLSARLIAQGSELDRRSRFGSMVKTASKATARADRRSEKRRMMKLSDEEILRRYQATFAVFVSETGVYSFAGDPRSILMWSHYGRNHEGICYVFDVAADPDVFLHAASVDYAKEYPTVNALKDPRDQILTMVRRKFDRWMYEDERRIIVPTGARSYKSFRPDALFGVIVGCRAPVAVIEAVRTLLKERAAQRWPDARLYRCERHPAKYALQIRKA